MFILFNKIYILILALHVIVLAHDALHRLGIGVEGMV